MQLYELMRPIGSGGMGMVFEGRKLSPIHEDDIRPVAIKIVRPRDLIAEEREAAALFKREATFSFDISHTHPNLVTTYDYGISANGYRYLVMELIHGVSVSDISKDQERLPYEVIRRIGIDLLLALEHLHKHNVVHRDVTSRNVLIARAGQVILADFGLIKPAFQSGSACFRGTAEYAAPEAIRGQAVGPMTDLYSAGVLLYRLATGGYPYGTTVEEILVALKANAPVPELPEDVPNDLARIIQGLIPLAPADRRWHRTEDVIEVCEDWGWKVASSQELADVVEIRSPAAEQASAPLRFPDLGWPFAEMEQRAAAPQPGGAVQQDALPQQPPTPTPSRFMRWLPWALLPLAFAAGPALLALTLDHAQPPTASSSVQPRSVVLFATDEQLRSRPSADEQTAPVAQQPPVDESPESQGEADERRQSGQAMQPPAAPTARKKKPKRRREKRPGYRETNYSLR